jgi:nicotinamidase-related amidase
MIIDTDQIPVNRLSQEERSRADETALIIVDMMNRFCDPVWLSQGDKELEVWYTQELKAMIPNVERLLDGFRRFGALVVHVVTGKWTVEGRELVPYMKGRDYDLFDTPATSVIDSLEPLPGEIIIRKSTSSAFTGTGLDYLLRNAGINNLALCGQFGSACVFYTLIQSREFGFKNYWIEDALLYGSQTTQALIHPLVGSHWATLGTTSEFISALE